MKVDQNKYLKIELEGKEIDDFKSAIIKIHNEQKRVGFKTHTLSDDEFKVLNNIKDKID